MTSTVLAISAAYVVIGVLLLTIGPSSRFAWWVKAAAIVVTSVFFVEVFFATKDLLGWPRAGSFPARFQLLWVRVVEPDAKIGNRGAIYLWIEEVDEHNVPDGVPARTGCLIRARSPTAPPRRATRSCAAGRRGLAEDIEGREARTPRGVNEDPSKTGTRTDAGVTTVDLEQFQLLQHAQRARVRPMPLPTLPPKP